MTSPIVPTRSPTKHIQENYRAGYGLQIDTADPSSTQVVADPAPSLVLLHTQRRSRTYQGRTGGGEQWRLQTYEATEVSDRECQTQQEAVIFSVTDGDVIVDLGGVPTVAEPKAKALLSRVPWIALEPFLSAIRLWVRSAPVRSAKVFAFSDPEVENWEEVVVELTVDADTPSALRLWRELANAVDQAVARLSPDERRALNQTVALHLEWADSP